MSENTKVYTLKATCKKCGHDFTYTRTGNLMGSPRSVCDTCNRRKGAALRLHVISVEE
ncbi:hypothetical protein [Anaeromyxobacter sp. PSR-1]|uniref:hypothetical protein n=1 Tax=Anaeromyxobacter sp. PSR-1 TaxID=1300915 RepID=UPI0005E491B9|nr:hypothetical protein [Anaeromyxobacter sp. PSR-1]GAO01950.1 hypothetical protein PSR1_00815 [Anaeromyxobacter sp. PSR-1]